MKSRRHRLLQDFRRLLIFGAFVVGGIVFIAALFPISTDSTSTPSTLSPVQTIHNLWAVLAAFFRGFLTLLAQMWPFLIINVAGVVAMVWAMAAGTTRTLRPGEYQASLDQVRGQPEIVGSVKKIMELFQAHHQFKKHYGGRPPKGILFEGPPGTGKTLLAKSVAGESGVPFLYASGAGFSSMFLGIPQFKMHRLFSRARKFSKRWGGCVIFIDELDAIGGRRTGVSNARSALETNHSVIDAFMVPGNGGDSALVNAILTEMDGMQQPPFFSRTTRRLLHMKPPKPPAYNILVIGATNRAQTLDPALLRHGRFDRKIHVGHPGEEGRKDIIAYYLNKVSHVPIDLDKLAKATQGMSPAAIEGIINDGLIIAHSRGRDALTYDDIWQAKLHHEIGLVEPVQYTPAQKWETAVHEAGHAVVAQYVDPKHTVEIITVRKRGDALGLVHSQEAEEMYSMHKSDMLARIQVSLAGMVAEEMYLGQSTTGPGSDLENATSLAVSMVGHLGMGDTLIAHGVAGYEPLKDPKIREQVNEILQEQKTKTRQFLEEHRKALELTRDALMEKDELTGDQFRQMLFENGLMDKPPVNMVPLPIMPPTSNGQHAVN